MRRSFVPNIFGLVLALRTLLVVLFPDLHIPVVALLHLLLHILAKGCPHTLFTVVPYTLQAVVCMQGQMVRTRLEVAQAVLVHKLAVPMAWLVLVTVVLGVC